MAFTLLQEDMWEKNIYMPSCLDTRGRFYIRSSLSPTFFPLFRNLVSFGNKSNRPYHNLESSFFYKSLIQLKYLVKERNDKKAYLLLVLYIEIGKNFMKSDEPFHSTEEIIKIGIKELNTSSPKLEGNLALIKIRRIIRQIERGEEVDGEEIIFKDATASGLQNAGILYGYKSSHTHVLNLSGDR